MLVFILGRVEKNKKLLLEQSDLDREMMYKELRKKKVALDKTIGRIKTQLMVGLPLQFLICW